MKFLFALLIIFCLTITNVFAQSNVTISGSSGSANGNYSTLKAAFDALNLVSNQNYGDIVITINSSTTETVSAVLYPASTPWNSLKISPSNSDITISGNIDYAPVIDLMGADNVTIDGRINSAGSTKNLTVINSSTNSSGTSAIRFTNGASNNTLTYCILKGSSTSSNGILNFTTYTAALKNQGNSVLYNDFTNSGGNRPYNAIYAQGSSGRENVLTTISHNNFYDFFNPSASNSYGIYLNTNNYSWTISDNSFYETGSFAPSAAGSFYAIAINSTTSGEGINFDISDNFIGGTAARCGGSALSKTSSNNNVFYGIYLYNLGSSAETKVQGNTIGNFNWANSGSAQWCGIYISKGSGSAVCSVKVGTDRGNIIGGSSGTGSVTFTGGASNSNLYGIYIAGSSIYASVWNNTVGSVTAGNSSANNATNFNGIYISGGSTYDVKNNTIGGDDVNSINCSSASLSTDQTLYGINIRGITSASVSDNIINNLSNGTSNSSSGSLGLVQGISAADGTFSIDNNTVSNLTIANANNSSGWTAPVIGIIARTIATAYPYTVRGNKISGLSNTFSSFSGHISGIHVMASTAASTFSRNYIYGISVSASSNAASIYGIKVASGINTFTNNIISLGGTASSNIYGFYDTSVPSQGNTLYFNTVYINGSSAIGSGNPSYCLYSLSSSTYRDFRNNIFVNARSTEGGSALHFAAYFNYSVSTNLTLGYNDYYVSGTGGVPGCYSSSYKYSLPIVTGKDAGSQSVNPSFANAGGSSAEDYRTSSLEIAAQTGTGITADFANLERDAVSPTMGAYEYSAPLPVELISFEADILNCAVRLKWETAAEVNNYGFEIQRSNFNVSLQESEWKTIGFIKGNGYCNSHNSYSFTDENPPAGKNRYRLKQLDNDGHFKYYETLIADIRAPEKYSLQQNSPNPFNPSTAIRFQLPVSVLVTIKVYDQTGREVTTLINQEKSAGSHIIYWNGRDNCGQLVSSSIYLYRLQAGDYSEAKKMNLLK